MERDMSEAGNGTCEHVDILLLGFLRLQSEQVGVRRFDRDLDDSQSMTASQV